MSDKLISICIPSYNRPKELIRLLNSIDSSFPDKIQIVITEDYSPKRNEIRTEVKKYCSTTRYEVKYIENDVNKGYDKNVRSFITSADGKYIVLMGDDDCFIPHKLDLLIRFLEENNDIAFVLRSYRNNYMNGDVEYYRYYKGNKFFAPGEESYIELFRRCVFVSGFTFQRKLAIDTMTDRFDGSLLYQLYIQAELCLNYKSAYFDEPITEAFEGGEFYFGSSETEKKYYTPNKHTVEGETKFISNFFSISEFIDRKYALNSTSKIKKEMSKYSFPMLALMSENGKKELRRYYNELKIMGFGCTKYFKLYYICIWLFGADKCKFVIRKIKIILKKTPKL